MKKTIFLVLVLFSIKGYAQKSITKYLELRASVDALGNIYISNLSKRQKTIKSDSLIDFSRIDDAIRLYEPIKVINKLSEVGWTLVSVAQISSDKEGRPNTPFILYYFKKDFNRME